MKQFKLVHLFLITTILGIYFSLFNIGSKQDKLNSLQYLSNWQGAKIKDLQAQLFSKECELEICKNRIDYFVKNHKSK